VAAVARFGSAYQDASPRRFEQIIGSSPALESVLEQVERVAPTDSTVLVQGETGTGKELIARAIHNLSSRFGRPFVKLNCAAIPFDLLESELFGHEKGAFTGAIAQKIGRFELADKGTLFLDEVGDIPLALQPKLLRVLQEQEFERLGSGRTHQVDVRLVAATHRNLVEMVKRNEFRSDLYYRLNVFPIPLPALRARREDIPALVEHFVEIYARRMNKQIERISSETMAALASYPWPGNIRELQNFIERSLILTSGNVLECPLASLSNAAEVESLGPITMEDAERDHIRKTLEQTRWVVSGPNGAAARLGIKRSTLYFRMQKLGISRTNKNPLPS
jgi:formate hydrogenlyase transcriptional activator